VLSKPDFLLLSLVRIPLFKSESLHPPAGQVIVISATLHTKWHARGGGGDVVSFWRLVHNVLA